MPGYVGRQRYAQSQTFAQLFQLVIDKVGGILILPAGIHLHILDNRQQIGRAGGIIFIDNFLHRFLPFDEKLLPGLLATVGKYPVLQVLLFQISYYSLVFYYNKRMWWLVSATYDAWEVLFYQQIEETYGKWSNDAV